MTKTLLPKDQKLSPLLKYPGGKEKELIYILPNLPKNARNYYEPFLGGGAVYFALEAENYFVNDKSAELIELYKLVKNSDKEFVSKLKQIDHNWKIIEQVVEDHSKEIRDIYNDCKLCGINKQRLYDKISAFVLHNAKEFNGLLSPDFNIGIQNFVNELIKNFKNKITRMVKLEKEKGDLTEEDFILNIECAFKSAFYMHFRFLYNNSSELNISNSFKIAIFYFLREFCYSSMFRYNKSGQFNVPYGGISYNKKYLYKKIEYFSNKELLLHLSKTQIFCDDFENFLTSYKPKKDDFMFLDPPYDTEFNTYAKNLFEKHDQERLAKYLKTECDCAFMLIIKNTDFILSLYKDGECIKNGKRLKINRFDKKYFVSFQNRNNKEVEHLIITNY